MALPRNYRFTAFNSTGQTILQNNITVESRRYKFTSAGALSFDGSETQVYIMDVGGGLATATYDNGTAVDNSSDLYIGGDFEFTVVAPASSDGNVLLYFDSSTDAGSTFPDNGLGILVATLNFTTSGTKITNFSL